jgi:hypothetical protein
MSKNGICTVSAAPIRLEPNNKTEMTSMLLFGESFSIIEEQQEWWKIITSYDQYSGWINSKLCNILVTANENEKYTSQFPLSACVNSENQLIWLLPGSTLPNYSEFIFHINDKPFEYNGEFSQTDLLITANQFLNAPYLWGGRSLFGIDCSGFTQIVFKIHHKKLLRDASQQATQGETVAFRSAAIGGDLAFFDNEDGHITHVGIMLDSGQIIHASGKVRIDMIDDHGIIQKETGRYSHKLRIIKRI